MLRLALSGGHVDDQELRRDCPDARSRQGGGEHAGTRPRGRRRRGVPEGTGRRPPRQSPMPGRRAFLGYRPRWASAPFPGVICTSVNDAVVHGIPNDHRLQDGDLLSVDCGAFLEGWCGDAAISFIVGTADPVDQALVDATDAALARGIEAARIGNKMGIWVTRSAGIAPRGYGLLADHGGHGIGKTITRSRMSPTTAGPAAASSSTGAGHRDRADADPGRQGRLLPRRRRMDPPLVQRPPGHTASTPSPSPRTARSS